MATFLTMAALHPSDGKSHSRNSSVDNSRSHKHGKDSGAVPAPDGKDKKHPDEKKCPDLIPYTKGSLDPSVTEKLLGGASPIYIGPRPDGLPVTDLSTGSTSSRGGSQRALLPPEWKEVRSKEEEAEDDRISYRLGRVNW